MKCERHPNFEQIGVCLSPGFVKEGSWRVCAKCMSVYCKRYTDFLLDEDIFGDSEVPEFPIDPTLKKVRDVLTSKKSQEKHAKSDQSPEERSTTTEQTRNVFENEIKQIDDIIVSLTELKKSMESLSNRFLQQESVHIDQIQTVFEKQFSLNVLRDCIQNNKDYLKESIGSISNNHTEEILGKYKKYSLLNEHKDISRLITQFVSNVDSFLGNQLAVELTSYKSLLQQNERVELSAVSSDVVNIEKGISKENPIGGVVELVRSKVPYPDALNLILYTRESFRSDENVMYSIEFNSTRFHDKCHIALGFIEESLRDEVGYNHDMPSMCVLCFLKSKNVDLSRDQPLAVKLSFIQSSQKVVFDFEELGIKEERIIFQLGKDQKWRLFVSMCFPVKFRATRIPI